MNDRLTNSLARLSPQQLQQLVKRASEKRGSAPASNPLLGRRRPGEALPLSYAQEHLWFIEQMEMVGAAYHVSIGMRLTGELDEHALQQSLDELVHRHESLRTRFEWTADRASQVIDDVRLLIGHRRPQEIACRARESALEGFIREESEQPFDLERGPLFRMSLLHERPRSHGLVIAMHHIISDAWSVGLITRELGQLYAGYSQGRPATLPRMEAQYADYALWQRASLEGAELERQLAYWKAQLLGAPDVLALPTDRPRPTVPSHAGRFYPISLGKPLRMALSALARSQGATLFMVLLAAYQWLLSCWSGLDDIVVGTPITSRTHRATEGLVGFFVNTLALRTRLDGVVNFQQLLARVKETALSAYAHQDLPFGTLVQKLSPTRDLAQQPIVQVSMLLENTAMGQMSQLQLGDLQLERVLAEHAHAKCDLTLMLEDSELGLRGGLEYATDLFDEATAARFATHLGRLLEYVVAHPETDLRQWDIVTPEERQQLLVTWNPAATHYPTDCCMHELFERQAACSPSTLAVLHGTREITYGELDRRANQLAWELRRHGVGAESVVALCLPRSPEMLVGVLGILKSGGAYLPIDPSTPAERVGYMLADARVTMLVGAGEVAATSDWQGARIWQGTRIDLIRDAAIVDAQREDAPSNVVHPLNTAYVIYTSGSTGQPKGVSVAHHSARTLAEAQLPLLGLRRGERILQFARLSFDASVWEMLMAWHVGATLCLVEGDGQVSDGFVVTLARLAVNMVTLPPSVLGLLDGLTLPHLHTIVVAGESCPIEHARALSTGRRFINAYGPTETTVCATAARYRPDESSLPIGQPIANSQVYVLDTFQRLAPIGVIGELYIGGPSLARGYLNRPALTAQRFVANPFGPPGSRLYRTGDLVRYRQNGQLEFLGRIDHQVKIRGFRIELDEVEQSLRALPEVSQAAVIDHQDPDGRKRLVGYVVPVVPGQSLAPLLEQLKLRLPDYMVPSLIVAVERIPLTANGKLDRAALPVPASSTDRGRPPSTEREFLLAGIFAEVLRVAQVGVDDSFFELGGDSISSIQLVSQVRKAGLIISPRDVFRYQNVAALALAARPVSALVEAPEAWAQIPSDTLPMLPIVRWWLEQGEPSSRFHQSMCLQIPPAANEHALAQALQALVDRHEALRLSLRRAFTDGEWQLRIVAEGTVNAATLLRRQDVRGLPPSALANHIADAAIAARDRLDPSQSIVLQAVWFDAGDAAPGRLLLVAHHLAVDGVSWRILVPDLAHAWRLARNTGTVPSLDPVATSLRHWAQLLRDEAISSARLAELSIWRTVLRGGDPLLSQRPLDPRRDTHASAKNLSLTLPSGITEQVLTRLPALFDGRINDILLGGFALAITQWRRRRQGTPMMAVRLDMEGHGREEIHEDVDLSRTVGWFTSLFPLYLDPGPIDLAQALAGGPVLGQAIKRIRQQLRQVPDHGLGYGLLRYLNPLTSAHWEGASPAQIAFNYLGRFAVDATSAAADSWIPAPEAAGLRGANDPTAPLAHAISLNALTEDHAEGARLVAHWSWAGALFDEADMRALAEAWFGVLTTMADLAADDVNGSCLTTAIDQVEPSTQVPLPSSSSSLPPRQPIPLTPVQRISLVLWGDELHLNASTELYTLARQIEPAVLRQALALLIARHDALRLGLTREKGRWVQWLAESAPSPETCCEVIDLTGMDHAAEEARVAHRLDALRTGADLASGCLLRAMLFIGPSAQPWRLAIQVHHFANDALSHPILLRELQTLCQQLQRGEPARLGEAPTMFSSWAQRLPAHLSRVVASPEFRQSLPMIPAYSLPLDHPDGINSLASMRVLHERDDSVAAGKAMQVATAMGLAGEDLILLALALALGAWSGNERVAIEQLNHGRVGLDGAAEVSASIGWFTTGIPISIDLRGSDQLRPLAEQLRAQSERVDADGLAYWGEGARRWEEGLAWSACPVCLNHQGEQRATALPGALFKQISDERDGVDGVSERVMRLHVIELYTVFADGVLHGSWRYSGNLHEESSMRELARQFRQAFGELVGQREGRHLSGPASQPSQLACPP